MNSTDHNEEEIKSTQNSINDNILLDQGLDLSSFKGSLVEHLRSKVRSESACRLVKSPNLKMLSSPNTIPGSETEIISETSSNAADINNDRTISDQHDLIEDGDMDDDDHDNDADLEMIQPIPSSIVNWKTGTVVSEDQTERKLSEPEMEVLR